jgi:hypothetical protein
VVTDDTENGNEEELDLSAGMVPHAAQPLQQQLVAPNQLNQNQQPQALNNDHGGSIAPAGQAPVMQKGTPISFGGKNGRVVFVHPGLGIARVKFDDGSQARSVKASALKILPHTVVTSHVRRLSS